jgi:glycerol-3-phosphate O-acyltransferase
LIDADNDQYRQSELSETLKIEVIHLISPEIAQRLQQV